jgi:hypothetical protein
VRTAELRHGSRSSWGVRTTLGRERLGAVLRSGSSASVRVGKPTCRWCGSSIVRGSRGLIVRRSLLLGVAAFLAVSVVGMSWAFAVTKSPGLLAPSDLPGSFQQTAPPVPFTQTTALTVDAKACTESLQPVASPISGVQASFARVGAPTGSLALIENVQVYRNARDAAKMFAHDAKNHAARLKCGTVGFIPQGSTTPGGTTAYQTAPFPKIGAGAYLESSGAPGTVNTNTSVTFVSGPYVVRIGTFGGTDPLTTADLKKIAPRALKRLRKPTPDTSTATTR